MKKIYCTAALLFCGMPALAHAEMAVSLYGVVDAGLRYESVDMADKMHSTHVGLAPNMLQTSRFGLRGQSPLGAGWQAVFQLESGFDPLTGREGPRLFGRDTFVGLRRSSLGTLKLGRVSNISDAYITLFDPLGESYGIAGGDTIFSNSLRTDNTIMFESDSINGISVGLGYSFEVNSVSDDAAASPKRTHTTSDQSRLFSGGMKYASGPITLAASYDRYMPRSSLDDPQAPGSIQAMLLGGSYQFPAFTLSLAFGRTVDGWLSGKRLGVMPDASSFDGKPGRYELGNYALAKGFSANSSLLGVSVPLSSGQLVTSWQHAVANNKRLTGGQSPFNVYALGYRLDLSKRTSLYAYGSYSTNYAFLHDLTSTTVGVGMRQQF